RRVRHRARVHGRSDRLRVLGDAPQRAGRRQCDGGPPARLGVPLRGKPRHLPLEARLPRRPAVDADPHPHRGAPAHVRVVRRTGAERVGAVAVVQRAGQLGRLRLRDVVRPPDGDGDPAAGQAAHAAQAAGAAQGGVTHDDAAGDVGPRPAGAVRVGEVGAPRELDSEARVKVLARGGRGQERLAHLARPPTIAFAVIFNLPCWARRAISTPTAVSALPDTCSVNPPPRARPPPMLAPRPAASAASEARCAAEPISPALAKLPWAIPAEIIAPTSSRITRDGEAMPSADLAAASACAAALAAACASWPAAACRPSAMPLAMSPPTLLKSGIEDFSSCSALSGSPLTASTASWTPSSIAWTVSSHHRSTSPMNSSMPS